MTAKRLLIFVAVLAALATAYFWAALSWTYSSGERAGWVQKLSKKGWICKTWEGEVALVTMPGAIPEKFVFTIRDDAVAERVMRSMGKRVSLHYEEKVGLPTSCFGDTRHFVVAVSQADAMSLSPETAAPAVPAPSASMAASATR